MNTATLPTIEIERRQHSRRIELKALSENYYRRHGSDRRYSSDTEHFEAYAKWIHRSLMAVLAVVLVATFVTHLADSTRRAAPGHASLSVAQAYYVWDGYHKSAPNS